MLTGYRKTEAESDPPSLFATHRYNPICSDHVTPWMTRSPLGSNWKITDTPIKHMFIIFILFHYYVNWTVKSSININTIGRVIELSFKALVLLDMRPTTHSAPLHSKSKMRKVHPLSNNNKGLCDENSTEKWLQVSFSLHISSLAKSGHSTQSLASHLQDKNPFKSNQTNEK